MKRLLIGLFVISFNVFAQDHSESTTGIDSVTRSRFEDLKTFATFIEYSDETKTFETTEERQTLTDYLDPDFDQDDLCVLKQFNIVMDVLIANPQFINRLHIEEIQIDSFVGPSGAINKKALKVELYSDPILRVQVGTKNDIELGNRRAYCKLVTAETLLISLQSIARNH